MKLSWFKIVTIALILSLGFVGWVTVFGDKGWLAYRHLIQTRVQMQKKVSTLETENRRMSHEVYRLKHDKDCLERIVRRQLDMGKSNELVFKFKSHH